MTLDESLQIGLKCQRGGQLAEAEKIYREILAQRPDYPVVLNLLGVLTVQLGKPAAAVELLERAIRLKPDFAVAYGNLGVALASLGQRERVIECFREVIRLKPELPDAHNNLGNALWVMGRLDEAIAECREAIRLKPDFAEAYNNLGNVLNNKGQVDEAIAAFREAIRIKPDLAEAHSNLGNQLMEKGSLDEVIACHRNAIRVRPDFAGAYCNLGNAAKDAGRLDDAIAAYREAIRLIPGFVEAHSNLIFSIQFHPAYDAAMIYEESRKWNDRFGEPLRKSIKPHGNNRDPNRRLRVGYVSPDFRDHVIGQNMLPLMREHDRQQIEIFLYSNAVSEDAFSEQFRRYADGWHAIAGLSDSQAVELIRRDQIDILVELALHASRSRLVLSAHKPAPVQVTFAGYPGTTGLTAIDYRLTDPHLDPPGWHDQFYSEISIRLPDTFWCYQPLFADLTVTALPAQSSGYVTFGSLNNFCKVNEHVVQLWARVLKTVDRSRMMILCPEGSHRQLLLDIFPREGVEPDRVELIAPCSRRQYMELYHRIDVGLDTIPYNGHTTSLDSYWMGVPVVTLVGKTVVGRAGLSQLTNLGLTDLIGQTPEDYVEIAATLAMDLPRLAEIRRTLRSRMEASPLMDAPRFARNIEAAYRQMWRKWCQGEVK